MSLGIQEFKLKKINDHNKAQRRTLRIQEDRIIAMKKTKPTREIFFRDILGVTFNIAGSSGKSHRSQIIIHNPTGDLRYQCKDREQQKLILLHLKDH